MYNLSLLRCRAYIFHNPGLPWFYAKVFIAGPLFYSPTVSHYATVGETIIQIQV